MTTTETDWFKLDWDGWRRDYDSLTFEDQVAFYQRVAEEYPDQRAFDPNSVLKTFDLIGGEDLEVVEIGGWDGLLAAIVIGSGRPVGHWTNYDLIQVPQACRHPDYEMVVLGCFPWEAAMPFVGDVFIACHTIEHMRGAELARLFDVLRTEYIYLEAPLPLEGPVSWKGYPGSHILELGWVEISALLGERNYYWQAPGLWRLKTPGQGGSNGTSAQAG